MEKDKFVKQFYYDIYVVNEEDYALVQRACYEAELIFFLKCFKLMKERGYIKPDVKLMVE